MTSMTDRRTIVAHGRMAMRELRLDALKYDRERAKAALDRIRETRSSAMTFDPEKIERFGRLMRDNIASGAIPFRKAYLQSVIERIEVDDGIVRIVSNNATLKQAIAGGADSAEGVRRSVPKWRAR